MSVARIAALRAGLPDTVPAVTVNRFCSSGSQTIALAADERRCRKSKYGMVTMCVGGGPTHRRIRVTIVCPGYIRTKVSENALRGDGSAHAAEVRGGRAGCARAPLLHALATRSPTGGAAGFSPPKESETRLPRWTERLRAGALTSGTGELDRHVDLFLGHAALLSLFADPGDLLVVDLPLVEQLHVRVAGDRRDLDLRRLERLRGQRRVELRERLVDLHGGAGIAAGDVQLHRILSANVSRCRVRIGCSSWYNC